MEDEKMKHEKQKEMAVVVGAVATSRHLPDSRYHDCYFCGARIVIGKMFSDRIDRGEVIPCCLKCEREKFSDFSPPTICDEVWAELETYLGAKLSLQDKERIKALVLQRFKEGGNP